MKENELLQTTDAKVWAEEFVRLHSGDEGLMLAWFANAMMCAHDNAGRQNERHLDEMQRAIMRLPKPPSEMGDGPDERVSHVLGLLADERERVREMCCRMMCFRCAEGNKPFDNGTIWQHCLYDFHGKKERKETWFEDCEAAAIRQLDLTKDLAPSSTKEKTND